MDYSTILCWARANHDVIQLFSTVVVATATMVIAFLTFRYTRWTKSLVKETQLLRKAQTKPHISVSLSWSPDWSQDWSQNDPHSFYLVVRNDGFGQARDVRSSVDRDFLCRPRKKLSEMSPMQHIPCLQSGEAQYVILSAASLFQVEHEQKPDSVPDDFDVTVSYSDIEGKDEQETFRLHLRAFKEGKYVGMLPSALDSIAISLKKIQNSFPQKNVVHTHAETPDIGANQD
jgi:hypothetical protein